MEGHGPAPIQARRRRGCGPSLLYPGEWERGGLAPTHHTGSGVWQWREVAALIATDPLLPNFLTCVETRRLDAMALVCGWRLHTPAVEQQTHCDSGLHNSVSQPQSVFGVFVANIPFLCNLRAAVVGAFYPLPVMAAVPLFESSWLFPLLTTVGGCT